MEIMTWLAPACFGLGFAGMAYVLIQAFAAGTEAYSEAYSEQTARQFEDVFLFIPSRRLEEIRWTGTVVAFLVFFFLTGDFHSTGGFTVGFFIGLIAAGFAMNLPSWLLKILKKRRLTKFNSQLVNTLISMSNALKAGFSISQAIESVVKEGEHPISQEFDVFLQQTRVGVSFSEGLANMEQRVGSEDLSLVVMAIETARKTGGNLTEILEVISKTIRERMRIENRIRTLTAQGRLQGIVVGAMPVVICIALLIVDPDLMKPFLYSWVGIITLVIVSLLIAAGGVVIRKIVNIDV